MSVGRICTREVEVAASDETAQVAAKRMKSHNVGTLVVVDDDNCPVGLVTDRDLRCGSSPKDSTQPSCQSKRS
jgi:predicted transcriptional regulator